MQVDICQELLALDDDEQCDTVSECMEEAPTTPTSANQSYWDMNQIAYLLSLVFLYYSLDFFHKALACEVFLSWN